MTNGMAESLCLRRCMAAAAVVVVRASLAGEADVVLVLVVMGAATADMQ